MIVKITARALNVFMFFSAGKLASAHCDDVLVYLLRALPPSGHGNKSVSGFLNIPESVGKELMTVTIFGHR